MPVVLLVILAVSLGCTEPKVELLKPKNVLQPQNQVLPPQNQVLPPQNQLAPMEFIMDNFSVRKITNVEPFPWYSLPFYTHKNGYKFCLMSYPDGVGKNKGSYLTISAPLIMGEYDDELNWPFEGDIRVEVVNWRAETNHHSYIIHFDRITDPDGIYTSQKPRDQDPLIGYGTPRFISHTDLEPNTTTEYVRNNCLKLRVSVAVYIKPLLLTPVWQDRIQPGTTQFIISEYSKRKQFNNRYLSPSFTTSGEHRYTLGLAVYANGDGEGSHLSIFVYIMKGRHDDWLYKDKWPYTGTIVISLLNWLEDKEHYKTLITIEEKYNFAKVTDGEYGNNVGTDKFISHSTLINSSNNTQYLYQDSICVSVQAIAN